MANNTTETAQNPALLHGDVRTGLSLASLSQAFRDNLYYMQGRDLSTATLNDLYMAAAYTVRDRLMRRWMHTLRKIMRSDEPLAKLSTGKRCKLIKTPDKPVF